jgi:TRAP-type mannitol/chloroaromatic compound transport system permease small subunit
MGTLLSVLTIAASAVIVVVPSSSILVLYALAVLLGSHLAATFLRPNPGTYAAATLLGWAAVMIAHPLSLTDQQVRQMERMVRNQREGWEEAQRSLDFFEPLQGLTTPLLWIVTGFFILCVVVYLRRAAPAAFQALYDASEGLATACVRVGVAVSILFVPMILIIFLDVLQRKYLGWDQGWTSTWFYQTFPSTRLQEMQWHLHSVLFLLALGYAYVRDAHVRIELVRDMMGPRTRVWMELVGAALFLVPYCYVVIKYGNENALRAFHIGEGSDALTGLPYRFIIKGMLPLGFVIVALSGLSAVLRCVVYLYGPAHLRALTGQYAGSQHAQTTQAPNQAV